MSAQRRDQLDLGFAAKGGAGHERRAGESGLGYARLRSLYELSTLLGADFKPSEVLRCLAGAVPLRVGLIAEAAGGTLQIQAARAPGVFQPEVEAAAQHARRCLSRLSGAEPVAEPAILLEPEPLPQNGKPAAASRAAFAALPLVASGDAICGILYVRSARALAEADLAFLSAAADQLSIAWDRRAAWKREVRLRERAEALDRAQKELVAVVSHDLRNPLGAVLLGISTLRRWPQLDPAMVREHLDSMQRAGERASKLVHDLLDVARLDAGHLQLELEPVPVAALLRDAAELMRPLLVDRGLHCETQTSDGAVLVMVDRERVLQVLSNLIGNARKFAKEGSTVSVAAWSEGGEVRCCVSDEGQGIAAADLPRVFDRYFQGPHGPTAHGVGLGLSIARGIVEAHDGRIWATSEPGRGSQFFFTLPLA